MARRLAGKVAVVTGGTTGLGQREALCSGRRAEDNVALNISSGDREGHAPLDVLPCAIVPRGL